VSNQRQGVIWGIFGVLSGDRVLSYPFGRSKARKLIAAFGKRPAGNSTGA